MKTYSDKRTWWDSMQGLGMTRCMQETEFNTNHIYAVKDNKLIGRWDLGSGEGTEYSGKGMMFDGRRRKFKTLKIFK